MIIYIPTLGRAGKVRLENKIIPHKIVLVVQPQELDAYVAAYQNDYRIHAIQALPGQLHIGATRKWIIEHCNGENHIQMDDDVIVRSLIDEPFPWTWIEKQLESKAMVGFGRQYMGSIAYKKARHHYNDRVWHILGINYDAMKNVPVEKFSLYEDTVMNIHALQHGGTIVDYGHLLSNGSYTKENVGGCSTYRTIDEIQRNMTELYNLYPKWTSIVPSDALTQGLRVGFTIRTAWSNITKGNQP